MPIVHHLLSSSVQTAYGETGVSNHSISFMKIIYTGVYMILDAQNLHTFHGHSKWSGRSDFGWTSFNSHLRLPHIPTSVNTKKGYACYDCFMLSSPAFVCMHAEL